MKKKDGKNYREFRCKNCRKLLCLEYIYRGRISIKCPRCNIMNNLNIKNLKEMKDGFNKVKFKGGEIKNGKH